MIDLFKLGVTITLADKTGPAFRTYIDTVSKASKATDVLIERLDLLKLRMSTIGTSLGSEMQDIAGASLLMGHTVSLAMKKITASAREARNEASALARTVGRTHGGHISGSHRIHAGVAGGMGAIFGLHEAAKAMELPNDMMSMWANLQMTSPNKNFAKSIWKASQQEFNRNPILSLSHTVGLGGEIYRATGEQDPAAIQAILRQTLRLSTILTESAHIRGGTVDENVIMKEVRAFPRLLDLLNIYDPAGIKRVSDIFGSVMGVYGTDFEFQRLQKTISYLRGLGMINNEKDLLTILPQQMIESGRAGGGSSGGVAPGMVGFAQLFSGKVVTKRTAALWQKLGIYQAGSSGVAGGGSILDSISKKGGLVSTTTTNTQADPSQLNPKLAMMALIHPLRFGDWLLKSFEKMNPKLAPALAALKKGDQSDNTKKQIAWLFQQASLFGNGRQTVQGYVMDIMMKTGLGKMAKFQGLISGKGAAREEHYAKKDPFIQKMMGKHSVFGAFLGELFMPMAQDVMTFWGAIKKTGTWLNTFASNHPRLMEGLGRIVESGIMAVVTGGFGLMFRGLGMIGKFIPGFSKMAKPFEAIGAMMKHLIDPKAFKWATRASILSFPWASEFFNHVNETHPYQFSTATQSPSTQQPVHLYMDGHKVGEAFIRRLTDSMQFPTVPLGGNPAISFTPMGH